MVLVVKRAERFGSRSETHRVKILIRECEILEDEDNGEVFEK